MIQKYAAALISVAITLVAALAQLTGAVTIADAVQLALLALNSFLIYLVPLFGSDARSIAKTAVAVIVAVLTALAPLILPGHQITGPEWAVVVLAALQAFGAHLGVQLRNDSVEVPA